jgi:hypothetical protein
MTPYLKKKKPITKQCSEWLKSQMVEHLLCKREALSWNSSTIKKKKKEILKLIKHRVSPQIFAHQFNIHGGFLPESLIIMMAAQGWFFWFHLWAHPSLLAQQDVSGWLGFFPCPYSGTNHFSQEAWLHLFVCLFIYLFIRFCLGRYYGLISGLALSLEPLHQFLIPFSGKQYLEIKIGALSVVVATMMTLILGLLIAIQMHTLLK